MGITILIVDAEQIFAEAVAAKLDAEQDMTVVATCRPDSRQSLENARRTDVVLLDVDLPGGTANSLYQTLTSLVAPPCVIMLSNSSEPKRIVAALRAGASAWVRKDESFTYLLQVIRGTARGETWLPPAETGTVVRMLMRAQSQQQEENTLLAALTPREREILACLADGAGRRDVAERLYLSANTVRTHLRNLMAKLGVHSTLEAVALIRRGEFSDLPPGPSVVFKRAAAVPPPMSGETTSDEGGWPGRRRSSIGGLAM
jgi:DNA-binding NarL/FixJ family response regulator